MKWHPVALGVALLAITLLGYFQFPGHTILQSDTQIYIPILERAEDSSLYARDAMVIYPHVGFTLYDEVALALKRVTHASFESILQTQQFVYRLLGVLGLFLIAAALGLQRWQAIFVTAVVSLGATINGPAVLSVEYEPVPRGFALPFLLLSIACVGNRRWPYAALCAGIAFGFHPPTALGYSLVLLGVLCWERQFRSIAIYCVVPCLLLLTMLPLNNSGHPLFGKIPPELEALQRMRATYNWVSMWVTSWASHYGLLFVAGLAALWRIREHVTTRLTIIFTTLPLAGLFSVPISYLLLERSKLSLIPQFQPGRYLLFVTLFAVILGTVAAMHALRSRRWWEAALFLILPFAVPMNPNVVDALLDGKALLLAAGLALAASLLRSWALIPAAAAFFLIPYVTQVKNFAKLHHPEVDQLAAWARSSTHKDALFQFADLGRDLSQGVFRARSLRALYVDWKAGGQVNFVAPFADIWRERWARVQRIRTHDEYRAWGIDYIVYRNTTAPGGAKPVYRNSRYSVYSLH